jgi:hypothetical protein
MVFVLYLRRTRVVPNFPVRTVLVRINSGVQIIQSRCQRQTMLFQLKGEFIYSISRYGYRAFWTESAWQRFFGVFLVMLCAEGISSTVSGGVVLPRRSPWL